LSFLVSSHFYGRVVSLAPNHGNSITSWISTSNVVDPNSSSCLEGRILDGVEMGQSSGPGRAELGQSALYVARSSFEKLVFFGNSTGAAWLSERIRVFEKVEREAGRPFGGVRSLAAGTE
jgi:hypothetical protein